MKVIKGTYRTMTLPHNSLCGFQFDVLTAYWSLLRWWFRQLCLCSEWISRSEMKFDLYKIQCVHQPAVLTCEARTCLLITRNCRWVPMQCLKCDFNEKVLACEHVGKINLMRAMKEWIKWCQDPLNRGLKVIGESDVVCQSLSKPTPNEFQIRCPNGFGMVKFRCLDD